MDDGVVLSCDVFRPVKDGRYPVILTYGPYAKGLAFQDGYPSAWQRMAEKHPDVTAGSSNKYQNWEVVDPEKWVPHDYACVRVNSRGCGCSPGFIDHFSPRETRDFYDCIEWAAQAALVERQDRPQRRLLLRHQPVACRVPAAAAPRRHVHLGGRRRLVSRHDAPRRHPLHVLGALVRHAGEDRAVRRGRARQERAASPASRCAGRKACPNSQLARNRCDFGAEIREHPLDDEYHKERSPNWSKIKVPLAHGRQLGRPGAASARQFRGLRARRLQAEVARGARARALDALLHRLRPPAAAASSSTTSCTARRTAGTSSRACSCRCAISTGSSAREESEWPLARTKWTKLYLDPADASLRRESRPPRRR